MIVMDNAWEGSVKEDLAQVKKHSVISWIMVHSVYFTF